MFRGDMDRATVVAAMPRDEDSDSDHELPSEVQFDHKVTRRSRGTVHHDSLAWTKHHESYSQNHYTLALASHKRWSRDLKPVPFGLVIRSEDMGA